MKKIILSIIGFALLLSFAVPMSANAGFIGKYCFKYDSYADTWIWYVDQVGDAYQVTGRDITYTPDASMDGGGAVEGSYLLLTVDERIASAQGAGIGTFGEHNIKLNLSTLKGTDYLVWSDINGVKAVNYPAGLAFSVITCPLADAETPDGPTTAGW